MSGLDGLRLDADGYLDMDVHGTGPELGDDAVLDLRDALLADPVEEPTADEWADLVDASVAADADVTDAGPFAVDDLPPLDDDAAVDLTDPDPDVDAADAPTDDPEAEADADAEPSDAVEHGLDTDLAASSDDWALDEGAVDLDVVELEGGDDLFPDDAGDPALPDVVPDI